MAPELPTFARMVPPAVHAPGLFRSTPKSARDKYVRIEYEVGPLLYKLTGPMLGASELRVLQGLVALASRQPRSSSQKEVKSSEDGLFDKVDSMLGEAAQVTTTYNELARCIGYSADSGSAHTTIKKSLELLCSVSVFVGRSGNHVSKDTSAGHLIHGIQGRERGGTLTVHLSPVLASALLGTKGSYLRLDMEEVRKLRSDPARLIHQRLHWINAGDCRRVGIDTLCGYVSAGELVSESAQRTRRQTARLAVEELVDRLGWSAKEISPTTYSIGRPSSPRRPARTQTRNLPECRREQIGDADRC